MFYIVGVVLLQMVANFIPETPQSKPNEAKEGLLKIIRLYGRQLSGRMRCYYPLNVDKNQNVGTKLNYVPFYILSKIVATRPQLIERASKTDPVSSKCIGGYQQ